MTGTITVAEYLLIRMKEIGIDHLFGIPGNFVFGLFNQVQQNDLKFVGTCNELNAAYAADGYARIRGIGAFATTFGVGELSALSGMAGAYAERVPIVMIVGSPEPHHSTSFNEAHPSPGASLIPSSMFDTITAVSVSLVSGIQAPAEIDRALLTCLSSLRPVHISLPSDVANMSCYPPKALAIPSLRSQNPKALGEAVEEAALMLGKAKRPIIIAGMELIRFKLQKEFSLFLDKTGFPYVTMMPGKGVLPEMHPQFIGVFEGERSRDEVRNRVASADCVLQLGAAMPFPVPGGASSSAGDSSIRAFLTSIRTDHHLYEGVHLHDFITALAERLSRRDPATLDILCAADTCIYRCTKPYDPESSKPLTFNRFFDRMSHFVEKNSIVITEAGASLFSVAEMLMPEGAIFIGQSFYGSIGYTIGATLGAAMAAQDRRIILFVGDGSFQVTCQDLATMLRYHLKPIIFLLNNDAFALARAIGDRPHSDIQPWRFHMLVDVVGGGLGLDVRTEGELEAALEKAVTAGSLVFIEVHTGQMGCPETLRQVNQSIANALGSDHQPGSGAEITDPEV